ncbi:binding-protein-dependent transport systems inner membrane component [Conexibacter woesei DSM 14684]|uniref:Binding-protein-dependent transport systems inner membrane component n=1 Tax=Conexibacter woesei (strain DSM 14684 / CCUG 47730 / CIP 108061 / JCM 11494 / NBRC 100937 / ID131577) TaxID=469383 RepID=D3F530_CONWI|nr:binding-protein-dependent transport systems inner membrane component [Conexibacter woesei DSM 14684]
MPPQADSTAAPRPPVRSQPARTRARRRSRRAAADRRFGLYLALPALIVVLGLIAWPAIQTLIYSLQRVALNGDTRWVGLRNFKLLIENPDFVHSLWLTAVYAIAFLVVSTVLGLAFALLLNERFRGRWLARTLLIVPWACPWVIAGIIWKWFADGDVGALNGALYQIGVIDEYKAWLSSDTGALIISVLAAAWRQASFAALLFLAGLQTIPHELPEAAKVDGATAWQRFRLITLPWLKPVIVVVIVINVIFGFMQFDVIYALTQGGPGNATEVLSIFLYEQLFVYTNVGLGSATAVVLGVVALLIGLLFVKVIYRSDDVTKGVS